MAGLVALAGQAEGRTMRCEICGTRFCSPSEHAPRGHELTGLPGGRPSGHGDEGSVPQWACSSSSRVAGSSPASPTAHQNGQAATSPGMEPGSIAGENPAGPTRRPGQRGDCVILGSTGGRPGRSRATARGISSIGPSDSKRANEEGGPPVGVGPPSSPMEQSGRWPSANSPTGLARAGSTLACSPPLAEAPAPLGSGDGPAAAPIDTRQQPIRANYGTIDGSGRLVLVFERRPKGGR